MSTDRALNDPTVECRGRDAADCDRPSADNPGWAAWRHNWDECLAQYLDRLIWQSHCYGTAEHDACRGEDCDSSMEDIDFTGEDLTPGAMAEIEEDLHGFLTSCLFERPNVFDGMDAEQVGHDFCLTRNGHGAGFWDRGLGERGEWLTAMSKPFGESSVYVGDDGKLYVHG